MFSLLFIIIFGFIIGFLAKAIHPGENPEGFIATTIVGVCGSAIGHLVAESLSFHGNFIFSIAGGVAVCALWRWYKHLN